MTTSRLSPREWPAIIALLLLAFALRTIDLTRVPPGLHNDEVVAAKLAERVMNGDIALFYPDDTGSEPLHYFVSGAVMRVWGGSVWALRWTSVILSLIAQCVVWALARRLFGPIVALVAMAGFAVTFWTVEFGRIVSPVVIMVPLVTLSAYLFWRGREQSRRREWLCYVLSGAALGLALLAYTAPRIIPVIFVIFGLYAALTHRDQWQRWLVGTLIVAAVAALVAAPMFIHLAQHPEYDQLDFFDIDRPLDELKQGNLLPVIETSLRTLGMFSFVGDPLPYYDVPDRPVLEPFGSALLSLGLLVCVRRWRRPEYAFVFLWFFLSLAPGMLSQPAPNYTRTLGAQTVLFIAIGLGAKALLDRWRTPLVIGALGLIFAGNSVWTVYDYFTLWPSIDTVRFWHHSGLYAVANYAQRDPASTPLAICLPDFLIDEREPWWNPAPQHVRYLLRRADVSVRTYNCADTLILIDGAARYAFPDAADDATLEPFPIYQQFLRLSQPDRVTLPDRLGVILTADLSTTIDRYLAAIAGEAVSLDDGSSRALPVALGGRVELLGYTLSAEAVGPGERIELTTVWRVIDQLPPQLSQFTHVLNGQGDIAAQQDRLMLTSQSLRAGDVFMQIHRLARPADAGTYTITIGLYTQPDGQRLPIVIDGQPRGNRLFLGQIEVR